MYHSRKALPWQQRTLAVVVGSGHARASGLARIAGDGHGQHAAAIHLHQVAILPCGHHQVIQITRCLRERGPHDAALAADPGKLAVHLLAALPHGRELVHCEGNIHREIPDEIPNGVSPGTVSTGGRRVSPQWTAGAVASEGGRFPWPAPGNAASVPGVRQSGATDPGPNPTSLLPEAISLARTALKPFW